MAALDLGTADRVLIPPSAPWTTLAYGSQELKTGPSYDPVPHPIGYVGGHPAIPRSWLDGALSVSSSGSNSDKSTTFIQFVAIAGPVGSAYFGAVASNQATLEVNSTNIGYVLVGDAEITALTGATLTTPHDAGVTVYAFVSNETERYVANSRDGILGTIGPQTPGVDTDNVSLGLCDDAGAYIMGVWRFDSTDTSQAVVLETLAAIADMLAPVPGTSAEATGGWGETGTALATPGLPSVAPSTAAPTPGGTAALPADPAWTDDPNRVSLRHVWARYSAPTIVDGRTVDWTPEAEGYAEIGHIQTIVQGVDITVWGGVETPLPEFEHLEPFGYGAATITLPQLTTFHTRPAWAKTGANVHVRLIPAEGSPVTLYRGVVANCGAREDDGVFTLECDGLLFQANADLRRPAFDLTPKDIGVAIPRLLNAVPGRRYEVMAETLTGIRTTVAGGWDPVLSGYVQDALATAVSDGGQWTVSMDDATPVLELKDRTTIAWEVRAGQEGVDVDLIEPGMDAPNVIFAEGIDSDGGRWRNSKYPNMHLDDTPPYPFTNPATLFHVGLTDAGTDAGNGVSVWQAKAGQPVAGVFTVADRARLIEIQRAAGITVDGSLGPQSWAATFDTGANTGTLDGAFIAPIAFAPEVVERLYGPDGDDLGPNPAYDPDVLWLPRYINFGSGVSKAEGERAAAEMLARDIEPGWVGTVTFDGVSPEQMHRYLLRAGQNGIIRGWHGEDITVHVAKVTHRGDQATLHVDTNARDYPTLDAILTRDRAAVDPARKALDKAASRMATDRPVYDAESKAGRLPRHAIYTNKWDVRKIPVGAYGSIVRTEITTSGPARPFAFAVFSKPVTAAQLLAVVGNPLAEQDDDPWQIHGDELDALGLVQAWGWHRQAAGYYPRQQSNPDGETSASATGRLVDDGSWEYASQLAPWLWVATIAPGACYVEGRLFGAPESR